MSKQPKVRFGRFTVSNVEFQMAIERDDYSVLDCLYEGMIVVRAECVFHRDRTEVVALNPAFDLIERNEEAPNYRILLTKNVDDDNNLIGYTRQITRINE